MKRFHHLHLIVLLLIVFGSATVSAEDNYYNCVVVEHLQLTKEGYRPAGERDAFSFGFTKLGDHFRINKQSGEVMGSFFTGLQWERTRVVQTSDAYNILITRGYASDGTPEKEIVVTKWSGVTQFVSIDLMTDLEVLDGICK
jgi:hypothetical protein